MPVRPDDREEFIRLRGTAITAGRAEELASIATGGQPVESEVVEELRLRVCKLKEVWPKGAKDAASSLTVRERLNQLNKISKAAGELNGMLVSLDDETRRWMWRVGSRSRWKIETADLFRRLAASRKASLAEVPVGVFTDGSLLFNAIDLAIQDLRSVVEETINEGRESGPTKGRPPGKSEVTTVRLTAAGEIGAIYRDLTGERPKRVVKKVSRKGVRGGYASQEGGPWHSFLSAMEDEIFGDHRGVEARAREVARGMDKNPAAYWSI